jgi:hypothetical protein
MCVNLPNEHAPTLTLVKIGCSGVEVDAMVLAVNHFGASVAPQASSARAKNHGPGA